MDSAPLVAVDVPVVGDARRKTWAKVVLSVDSSKDSGWAFEGEFVATGGIQDLPVGGVLLVYGETGSRANPNPVAAVFTVNGDATLTREADATGRAWARTLRDPVRELVEGTIKRVGSLLSGFSDEDLIGELTKRGYSVER